MELKELTEKLKSGENIAPGELSKYRLELSGWFAFYSGQLEDILKRKPEQWLEIRKTAGSDKMTDMRYNATEDGQEELALRLRLKSIEKIMSSIRLRLEIMEKESQNYY